MFYVINCHYFTYILRYFFFFFILRQFFPVLSSHLRFNTKLYTNFLILMLLTNFLYAMSSFILIHFLWKVFLSISSFLCVSEVYVIHSLPRHIKDISSDLSLFQFQIRSPNHAVAFHSCSLQHDVCNSFPHSFFISQDVLKMFLFFHFLYFSLSLYIVTFRKLYMFQNRLSVLG